MAFGSKLFPFRMDFCCHPTVFFFFSSLWCYDWNFCTFWHFTHFTSDIFNNQIHLSLFDFFFLSFGPFFLKHLFPPCFHLFWDAYNIFWWKMILCTMNDAMLRAHLVTEIYQMPLAEIHTHTHTQEDCNVRIIQLFCWCAMHKWLKGSITSFNEFFNISVLWSNAIYTSLFLIVDIAMRNASCKKRKKNKTKVKLKKMTENKRKKY